MIPLNFIGYMRRVKPKRIGYLVPLRLLKARSKEVGGKGKGEAKDV